MQNEFIRFGVAQINVKRHWAAPVRRVKSMLNEAYENGARIVTINEISRAQAIAIRNMPGWGIHWEINDHLRGGDWAGNAVAWRRDEFVVEMTWGQKTEINYRRGKKYGPKGNWHKRTLTQACVKLRHRIEKEFSTKVQAYHYPTKFNSDEESRQKCADNTASFARGRIKVKRAVIVGGDGNGQAIVEPGLDLQGKDGPDEVRSNGKKLKDEVLPFKRLPWRRSDHNGVCVTLRFPIPQ